MNPPRPPHPPTQVARPADAGHHYEEVRRINYLPEPQVPAIVPSVAQQPAAGCRVHHPAMEPGAQARPAPARTPPPHSAKEDNPSAEKAAGGWKPQSRKQQKKVSPYPFLLLHSHGKRRGGGWRVRGGEEPNAGLPGRVPASHAPRRPDAESGERGVQMPPAVHSCTTSESSSVSRSSRGTRAAAINMRQSSPGLLLLPPPPPPLLKRRCRGDQKSPTIPPRRQPIFTSSSPTPHPLLFLLLLLLPRPPPPVWERERWSRQWEPRGPRVAPPPNPPPPPPPPLLEVLSPPRVSFRSRNLRQEPERGPRKLLFPGARRGRAGGAGARPPRAASRGPRSPEPGGDG